MTISEAFEPFVSFCRSEHQVAPSTASKYRDCFNSWLKPWLGNRAVGEITRLQVLELRQAMVDRQLSVSRQYSVIMCLKSFLKFCRSTLTLTCLDPAEIKLPRRPAPQVEYLTDPEIQKILDAIDIQTLTGIRLRALIELLLSTGLRISESLSLKRQTFDTAATEAEIVGKGKKRRTVFFGPRCRFWVQQYLNRRLDDHPSLFVTTGYPPRKLAKEDLSRFFINLKAKTGLSKKFTPHILRHTFCTKLRDSGADISHIKDLAGHQDIQTTARYYLGKDIEVLRRVVSTCLNYGTKKGIPDPDPTSAVLPRDEAGNPIRFGAKNYGTSEQTPAPDSTKTPDPETSNAV